MSKVYKCIFSWLSSFLLFNNRNRINLCHCCCPFATIHGSYCQTEITCLLKSRKIGTEFLFCPGRKVTVSTCRLPLRAIQTGFHRHLLRPCFTMISGYILKAQHFHFLPHIYYDMMWRLRLVAFPLCMPKSSFQSVKSVDSVTVIRPFAVRLFRRNFYYLPCTRSASGIAIHPPHHSKGNIPFAEYDPPAHLLPK